MTQLNEFIDRNQQAIDFGWGANNAPAIRLFNKSSEQCQDAIGQEMKVRLDRKRAVSGVIVSAEPWRIRVRTRSAIVQAKIVMECGVTKTLRTLYVQRLPS